MASFPMLFATLYIFELEFSLHCYFVFDFLFTLDEALLYKTQATGDRVGEIYSEYVPWYERQFQSVAVYISNIDNTRPLKSDKLIMYL